MKYIPRLNEEWYQELLEDYDKAFNELFVKLAYFNSNVSLFNIEATPVKVEGKEYPFPMAVELEKMYLWMIGEQKRPENLDDIMENMLDLVWFNPFVDYSERLEIPWDKWTGLTSAHAGLFYRFAQISLKIENGDPLNATDLAIISGLSVAAIGKQIKEGKVVAEKVGTEWKIDAQQAVKWIENQNSKNSFK